MVIAPICWFKKLIQKLDNTTQYLILELIVQCWRATQGTDINNPIAIVLKRVR
jgi:hypothetical protein